NCQVMNNGKGFTYNTSGGGLDLTASTFKNNNLFGVHYVGSGILTGKCSVFEGNDFGAMLGGYSYLDLSQKSTGRPAMKFHNKKFNLVVGGVGLDFQNGANRFSSPDTDRYFTPVS